MSTMTTSQVNKLGDKLRSQTELDSETLQRLQDFRADYQAPMLKTQALVTELLGIDSTARLKTVNTIVEKLKRERTRLSTMQDVGGLRIVVGHWRVDQDQAVHKLITLFGEANTEVDDRRVKPSHGYRAVHVIPRVDGYPIEIQVRTPLQDLWAQTVERLADRVGRAIRYGAQPADAPAQLLEIFDDLQKLSDLISRLETLPEEGRAHIARGRELLSMPDLSPQQRQELEDMCSSTERGMTADLPDMAATMRHQLRAIVQALGVE